MINNYTPYLFNFQEIYDIDTETMQLFKKSSEISKRFKLMMRMADENIKCFLNLQQDFKEQWENSDLPPDKGIALEN